MSIHMLKHFLDNFRYEAKNYNHLTNYCNSGHLQSGHLYFGCFHMIKNLVLNYNRLECLLETIHLRGKTGFSFLAL